jgi:hypothetical protein
VIRGYEKKESSSGVDGEKTSNREGMFKNTNFPWIVSEIAIAGLKFPQVSTRLNRTDILGSFKARWGSSRMNYSVEPGLYGVGRPTAVSPVLVSANYKMSFDRLRKTLSGLDLWILVIDTKGINVWCAAGKGTFGTEELVGRIGQVRLGDVVSGRSLILPQLGAPGAQRRHGMRPLRPELPGGSDHRAGRGRLRLRHYHGAAERIGTQLRRIGD